MNKPILCLDFDGVIHSYVSGWVEHDFIPDPPVSGAFEFMHDALEYFDIKIFSSRGQKEGGIRAMRLWVQFWAPHELGNEDPTYKGNKIINHIALNEDAWPVTKPSAFVTIDDRALTFNGTWPSIEALQTFKPWNKK